MSSIRGMLAQARPQDDGSDGVAAPTQPAAASPIPLGLPALEPVEARRALSTRMTPSLQKVLQDYVAEFRAAGYRVSMEMVLEVLVEELRDDAALRTRLARKLAGGTRR